MCNPPFFESEVHPIPRQKSKVERLKAKVEPLLTQVTVETRTTSPQNPTLTPLSNPPRRRSATQTGASARTFRQTCGSGAGAG